MNMMRVDQALCTENASKNGKDVRFADIFVCYFLVIDAVYFNAVWICANLILISLRRFGVQLILLML